MALSAASSFARLARRRAAIDWRGGQLTEPNQARVASPVASRAPSWFPVLGQHLLSPGLCGLLVSGVGAFAIVPVSKFAALTRCSPWLRDNNTGGSSNGRKHKDGKQHQLVRHGVFSAFAGQRWRRESK